VSKVAAATFAHYLDHPKPFTSMNYVDGPMPLLASVSRRPWHATREAAADLVAASASWSSRALGRGGGEIIGGRLALRVDPSYLTTLAAGRTSVLVTGTNGKSTATSLVAAALSPAGTVVSNRTGANMPDGIVTTLRADRDATVAALEVDEVYLAPVVAATRPRAIVVLNVSREYTRGISLVRTVGHWRSVADTLTPDTCVIINADDPVVQYAFEEAPIVVPVAGRLPWTRDAVTCPACGALHVNLGSSWSCSGCARRRLEPDWEVGDPRAVTELVQEATVTGPEGAHPLRTSVPGRTASVSAMFALAAASAIGVDVSRAADAVAEVSDVDGRYRPFVVGRHQIRILMLKNPAGWSEAIDTAVTGDAPMVVAFEPFGPRDTTTLWEAPWEQLADRSIAVSGLRAADVVACLEPAGVRTTVAHDVLEAVSMQPPGQVVVACNYPAFRQLTRRLRLMASA
jgi:UDP-N-acetylmuramyl tripeptide synthase